MSSVAPAVGAGAGSAAGMRPRWRWPMPARRSRCGRPWRSWCGWGRARELEVLALLGSGLRNADLAVRLHISEKTVDHHVSAILAKLGVRSRREAARVAAQRQLLHGDGDGEPAPPR